MEIVSWLKDIIIEETGDGSISLDQPFDTMNLDSLSILSISHEIEAKLQIEVDPTSLTEYDTINKLSKWIQQQQ